MYKIFSIYDRWQFICYTNSLYRAWFLIPCIRISYVKTPLKFRFSHQFSVSLDWLAFGCSINKLSQ